MIVYSYNNLVKFLHQTKTANRVWVEWEQEEGKRSRGSNGYIKTNKWCKVENPAHVQTVRLFTYWEVASREFSPHSYSVKQKKNCSGIVNIAPFFFLEMFKQFFKKWMFGPVKSIGMLIPGASFVNVSMHKKHVPQNVHAPVFPLLKLNLMWVSLDHEYTSSSGCTIVLQVELSITFFCKRGILWH